VRFHSNVSELPRTAGVALRIVALSLTVAGLGHGSSGTATAGEADAAVRVPPTRHGGAAGIDDRVTVLTKALALDAAQQAQVRTILMNQRAAVLKIWRDNTLLPAERAPATLATEKRTGEEIRAILTDEQRKKYTVDKPGNAADQGDKRTVEQWLDASRGK
jgi:hypothetical protein